MRIQLHDIFVLNVKRFIDVFFYDIVFVIFVVYYSE